MAYSFRGGGLNEVNSKRMAFTTEAEQMQRGKELSPEECFKLRMELSEVNFTEEEKQKLTKEERERFINPPKRTDEEIEKNNRTTFKVLQNWKILPKDITFEEWIKAGKPLNY